ncbi:glycosyltransferase family 25 protein [Morganella morganii]|uniref:glycosyltransferase family 25 protein n=1 Tax=Morganella morganii TaxID=582 RepID=UPI00189B4804|nr:glycosyltransferase family 25 protein [Morganella morganii]
MVKVNWDFIDKVVYINLAKRLDRRKSIEFQMKKIGIPADKIIRFEAIENENGALGCVLSHIDVLKMAEENNWNNVLILEDDMVFNDDDESSDRINYFFSSLMSSQWDAALLSGSYFRIRQAHGCFYHLYFSFLTNSYIVNHHYYNRLIYNFKLSSDALRMGVNRNKCSLDYNWNRLMKNDAWYAVYPVVGYQMVCMSDIENEITDRSHLFSRTLDDMWPLKKT